MRKSLIGRFKADCYAASNVLFNLAFEMEHPSRVKPFDDYLEEYHAIEALQDLAAKAKEISKDYGHLPPSQIKKFAI